MNTSDTSQLSPKQISAITLLALGKTQADVAKELGVTPETISVWCKNLEFEASLNCIKKEALDNTIERLQSSSINAAIELENIALKGKSEEVRRKACLDILDIVGIKTPANGTFAWNIGAKTEDMLEVERFEKMKSDAMRLKRSGMIEFNERMQEDST